VGDLQAALAFVARRNGKTTMPLAEWAHHLSFGLGWMTPAQARAFVTRAEAAGLLATAEGPARLTFDATRIEAPLGFRPDPEAKADAPAAPADPFAQWLPQVANRMGTTPAAVLQLVAERQGRMGGLLTAWAALLWLGAEAGLDVRAAASVKA